MQRLAALLIDAASVLLLAVPLLALAFLLHPYLPPSWKPVAQILLVLALLALLFLPAWMDSLSAGSVGKRLLQLRVIDARGSRPGLLQSSARHVTKLGLHSTLPVLWMLAERLLFRGEMFHDWLSRTRVIHRHSTALQITALLPASFAPTVLGRLLRGLAIAAMLVLSLTVVIVLLTSQFSEPDPLRVALAPAVAEARQVAAASENYFHRFGRFPAQQEDLGIHLDPLFAEVSFNPENGSFRLALAGPPDALVGRSLVLYPEFRSGRSAKLRRWRCGSPDIARRHLPWGCTHNIDSYSH